MKYYYIVGWIVYCSKKNSEISKRKDKAGLSFDDCIEEIESGDFLVIKNHNKNHPEQPAFLIQLDNYPVIVPFNKRGNVIQLITLYPDRRYKNGQ